MMNENTIVLVRQHVSQQEIHVSKMIPVSYSEPIMSLPLEQLTAQEHILVVLVYVPQHGRYG